jgi:hypothetical protein
MIFMRKIVHMAHSAKKTSVVQDNIHDECHDFVNVFLQIVCMRHTTSDPKQKKSEDRGMILSYYMVGFYMLSKACFEERRSL